MANNSSVHRFCVSKVGRCSKKKKKTKKKRTQSRCYYYDTFIAWLYLPMLSLAGSLGGGGGARLRSRTKKNVYNSNNAIFKYGGIAGMVALGKK